MKPLEEITITRKEALRKVVKALKQPLNQDKQTLGRLGLVETDGVCRFCVLGLICETLATDLGINIKQRDTYITYDGNRHELPSGINNFLQLQTFELVEMNDQYKYSFNTIGEYIENKYLHEGIQHTKANS